MAELKKLIEGYKNFYNKYFVENSDVYKKLATEGQFPAVAIIACSDSRVDPSIVLGAEPGDLFVIRNVANLVPPYQPDSTTYHGTSAAMEFAISNLKVKHVVVFGHSKCAGIRALMESQNDSPDNFVNSWMLIAKDAREKIRHDHGDLNITEQSHICEKMAVELSIKNLHTFPGIDAKIKSKELVIHGWYFDIDEGKIHNFIEESGSWEQLG